MVTSNLRQVLHFYLELGVLPTARGMR